MVFLSIVGNRQYLTCCVFAHTKAMKSQVIWEIITIHDSNGVNRSDVFVALVSITFSLTNFFKILINLTAQVSPQVIDEKILMMDLNLNNYLSTVIQLRQDVYTGIKILHRVRHGE